MSKNGPNKTVAKFRRANPSQATEKTVEPSLKAVFDAVQNGSMTAEEGAKAVAFYMEQR